MSAGDDRYNRTEKGRARWRRYAQKRRQTEPRYGRRIRPGRFDIEHLEWFRHSLRQARWSITKDWRKMSAREKAHSWPKVQAAFDGWKDMVAQFEAEVRRSR